jgi:hypothetical protein
MQSPEVIAGEARDVYLRESSCELGSAIENLGLAIFLPFENQAGSVFPIH